MTNEYNATNPGYYLNKNHWNSIYYNEDVEIELINKLIDVSYSLVFNSLPKKKQAGTSNENNRDNWNSV
ncbi:MmcQ/YjbR family DNA-binding protein [Desulfuribacillus alkaliarsenatis]|uniref:MmcQ/YjbR family DNA-binding protein n=1 Tax=Desulfuribacillus alkaliarsenatis TaxID=766136 RepID=UPI00345BC714